MNSQAPLRSRVETVQRIRAQRRAGILGMALAGAAIVLAASVARAQEPDQGLLLRPGEWAQEGGGYVVPPALATDPAHWPTDGWYRVTHKLGLLEVHAVDAADQQLPAFLRDIALQLRDPSGQYHPTGEVEAEVIDTHYVRVPGVKLVEGRLPTVNFSRHVLRPALDHEYTLALGDQPFTLTVHNGLRNKEGVPYGQGAHYVVTYGGETYTYLLGAQGWTSVLRAVTDLDGDGKPDFIVDVDGSNGSDEFLLLSSRAQPGANRPTATLSYSAPGC